LPENTLNEKLKGNEVNNNSERTARIEPMTLSSSRAIHDSLSKHDRSEERAESMPKSQNNPFPEDPHVEVFVLLTSSIEDWVLE